jgi:hypothetical protein
MAVVSSATGALAESVTSLAELAHVKGVTSAIQTQFTGKTSKVSPSVVGNFVSFAGTTGVQQDSGKKDGDYVHMTGDETIAGNKTFTGNVTVNNTGNLIFPTATLTLSNGTNSNVNLGTGVIFYISGPTGNFTITGLQGGVDGRMIILVWYTTSNYRMSLIDDATSTAANRIRTLQGDLQSTNNNARCSATLVYNGTDQRWYLTSWIT